MAGTDFAKILHIVAKLSLVSGCAILIKSDM